MRSARDGGVDRRIGAEVDREPAVGLERTASASSPSSCRSPGAQASTAVPRTAGRRSPRSVRSRSSTTSLSRCSSAMHSAVLPAVADQRQSGATISSTAVSTSWRVNDCSTRAARRRVSVSATAATIASRSPPARTRRSPGPSPAVQPPRRSGSPRRGGRVATPPARRPLVVAALASGCAARAEDAVAPLPLAQRVGPDPGPACDGRDVEPRAELLRRRTGLQVGGDGRGEILQHARVVVRPRPGLVSIAQSVPIVVPPEPSNGTPM